MLIQKFCPQIAPSVSQRAFLFPVCMLLPFSVPWLRDSLIFQFKTSRTGSFNRKRLAPAPLEEPTKRPLSDKTSNLVQSSHSSSDLPSVHNFSPTNNSAGSQMGSQGLAAEMFAQDRNVQHFPKRPIKERVSSRRVMTSHESSSDSNDTHENRQPQNLHPNSVTDGLVCFTPITFYDVKRVVLSPCSLKSAGMSDSLRCYHTTWIKVPSFFNLYTNESDPLPRSELHLRFALCDDDGGKLDHFPDKFSVKLSGSEVVLPPIVVPQYILPGSENKKRERSHVPINLTPRCRQMKTQYELTIEWMKETPEKHFVFGVWLVKHVDTKILYDRFMAEGKTQAVEETRADIIDAHKNDDGIAMDSLEISLLCPITRTRMTTPTRSEHCRHFQCFDAFNFLQMNESKPTWKCSICNETATYESLILDKYFKQVINKVGVTAQNIELLPNGDWRELASVGRNPPKMRLVENKTASSGKSMLSCDKESTPDIIWLDSDGKEEKKKLPGSDRVVSCPQIQDETIILSDDD